MAGHRVAVPHYPQPSPARDHFGEEKGSHEARIGVPIIGIFWLGDLMQSFLRTLLLLIGVCTIGTLTSGCAVYMAANQPDKKDLGVLKAGTPRSSLLAEFGTPIHTATRNGARVDIFSFTQGYSGLEKGGRAVLHGAADVLTLGIWEVVGTPIEGAANGTKVSVEVAYDAEDRVAHVTPLRGQETLTSSTN